MGQEKGGASESHYESMNKLTKSDLHLEEWEFEFQQRNKNCILMADCHCRGLYFNLPFELKLPVEPYDYIFSNSSRGYVKKAKKSDLLEKLKEAITDKEYLEYVLKSSIERMKEFSQVVDSINKNIQKVDITDKALLELWREFDKAYLKMMPWFYIPWYVSEENMLTDRVKVGLARHTSKLEKITDLTDALALLVFPIKKAAFQTEQEDFFELVSIAENSSPFEGNSDFLKKTRAYLHAYAWTKTFFFLPLLPLSKRRLIESIKTAAESGAREKFKNQQKALAVNREKTIQLFEIVKKDLILRTDIESARELGWVLTASVEQATKAGGSLRSFLDLIASRLRIKNTDTQYLTSAEIVSGLSGEGGIDQKEIEQRKLGHVYAFIGGETLLAVGKEGVALSGWFDTSINKTIPLVSKFEGQSVSRGRVKGKVRIAPAPQDSYRLKDGEILVCSMTGPDYVPAMKRALAIVTDEGGLLSHAAIMSREFGKPCIVGTKIATKVLKDGDLVEVNANEGVVKIIKKA